MNPFFQQLQIAGNENEKLKISPENFKEMGKVYGKCLTFACDFKNATEPEKNYLTSSEHIDSIENQFFCNISRFIKAGHITFLKEAIKETFKEHTHVIRYFESSLIKFNQAKTQFDNQVKGVALLVKYGEEKDKEQSEFEVGNFHHSDSISKADNALLEESNSMMHKNA